MVFAGLTLIPVKDEGLGGRFSVQSVLTLPHPKFNSQFPGLILQPGSKSSPDTAFMPGCGFSCPTWDAAGESAPGTTCVANPGLLLVKSGARENFTFANSLLKPLRGGMNLCS